MKYADSVPSINAINVNPIDDIVEVLFVASKFLTDFIKYVV